MKATCQDFAVAIARQSPTLQSAYNETRSYWSPDQPPVTILFAALGDQIAEDFDRNGVDANEQLFGQIEAAMASGDEELVTAVATGLIEAVASKLAHDSEALQRVLTMFGELSRKHAGAWLSG